jgi:hypothetical protein
MRYFKTPQHLYVLSGELFNTVPIFIFIPPTPARETAEPNEVFDCPA